jgi:ribose-phosphate pyrophosphokinase
MQVHREILIHVHIGFGRHRSHKVETHGGRVTVVAMLDVIREGLLQTPRDDVKHLRKQRNGSDREITVVSPDVGGVKIARSYADALGAELAIVAKQRISATVVEAMKLIGEVEGRDVIIVDDMTETAGTLCAAAETLKNNGAGRIYAGVSHAVLGDLGCERIMSSDIDEVITTDSTPLPPEACRSKVSTLTVAGLLGEAIQRIHNGKSVSSLFDIEGGSV